MLTAEQNNVLSLLRTSFGVSEAPPRGIPGDARLMADLIVRGGILLTVYPAIKRLADKEAEQAGADTGASETEALLRAMYHSCLKRSLLQDYEGNRILRALSDAGMDCIGLKGWEMRKFYPNSGMRQMSDLDILISPYHFPSVKNVMEQIGFTGSPESSWKHDNFSKGPVHVETHKRLTDDSGRIRDWEKGLWDRAGKTGEHIRGMAPEDFYIFHFVHLHKDFKNGALGLRRIADTWLLDRRGGADMDIVRGTLESFGMGTFHERMTRLGRAAMGEAPMDENSEFLLLHAFAYGISGTGKSYKAGRVTAMSRDSLAKGKLHSAAAAVFLPYSRMKAQFPALEKRPVLLPYFWAKRIAGFLGRNLKMYGSRLDYGDISEEDYREMKRFFDAGGV